jgi:proteasome lid subunit RPN8/RPN11
MAEFDPRQDPAPLRIRGREYSQMLDHLRRVYPHEGCGLLAGEDGFITQVYEVENHLASPTAYEMDPQQQLEAMIAIEELELELLAIYHSHPHGPHEPSAVDVFKAYYPESLYVIVSLTGSEQPAVGAFAIRDRQVEEIPLIVF